MTAKNIIH